MKAKISLGGTTRNHLAKIMRKLDLLKKKTIPSTYTLVYFIGLGGLCFPHLCTHSWKIMSTQKPIICINIFISKPFITQFSIFFSFKCPYAYKLDIFSCLFNRCIREWSKIVIKITKGENNYHLCSWHQWPLGISLSWLPKFITKWKMIKLIIYKKISSRLAFEVFLKINIWEKFPKSRFLLHSRWKNPWCYILETFSLCIHSLHQNIFFCKFN
jgi:hypothetical protein